MKKHRFAVLFHEFFTCRAGACSRRFISINLLFRREQAPALRHFPHFTTKTAEGQPSAVILYVYWICERKHHCLPQ